MEGRSFLQFRADQYVPAAMSSIYVIGPKKVFTRQTQGYRLERRTNQNGAEVTGVAAPLDQIVLCQVCPDNKL